SNGVVTDLEEIQRSLVTWIRSDEEARAAEETAGVDEDFSDLDEPGVDDQEESAPETTEVAVEDVAVPAAEQHQEVRSLRSLLLELDVDQRAVVRRFSEDDPDGILLGGEPGSGKSLVMLHAIA